MKKIVVHCADTFADMDIGVKEINEWHITRGFDRIGYHYVIRRDGSIEKGREENVTGAHVQGHNTGSIGICMVGGKARGRENPCNFTRKQWATLDKLVSDLTTKYPTAEVCGHTDLDEGKSCPTFNVKAWWGQK
jgi:N-acetylmuramoyl-L-alanine amidase